MNKTMRIIWLLYPTYLVITLISVGAVSWYAYSFLGDFFLKRTIANLSAQGKIIETQIVPYLLSSNTSAIDQFCRKTGKDIPTRITVLLPDGTVAGDTEENPKAMDNHADRPEIIEAVHNTIGSSIRYSRTLDIRMMYVAQAVKNNNQILGIIRTSLPLTEVDQELNTIQDNIAMGGLLIAILAAFISFYASRRISLPIENLKKGAEKFAAGDLNHRLVANSTSETEALAKTMNLMASKLQKRIENEINQRNEMETILSSMSEGIIALDMEERVFNFNQAAANMIEGLKNISSGHEFRKVIRHSQLWQLIETAQKSNIPVSEDIHFQYKEDRVLNFHASPIRDASNKRIGTLLVLDDVTQLRQYEKMRQDFVANVSHEIKTPLTAIKGFVETLQNSMMDSPEETEHFLSIIKKHADRLEAIVEDLLALSRIEKEQDTQQIIFSKSSINDVIRSSIKTCQPNAETKQVKILFSEKPHLGNKINSALFEQALINLIDNAIKYSQEDGEIIIATEQTQDEITISVQDNGIGIAPKHLPRLFERFYRVDKARSREQGGTGLGLSIVKHIVQIHGGYMTVESTPGKGSTFTMHLPNHL